MEGECADAGRPIDHRARATLLKRDSAGHMAALSSTAQHKALQLAMVKEREKGPKGGSSRPVNGVNTEGRRSTMGQGRSTRVREGIHNEKSSTQMSAKALQREHVKKNRAAEEKKQARRAAKAQDLELLRELEGDDDEGRGELAREEEDTNEETGAPASVELTDKQRAKEARRRLLDQSFRMLAVTDLPGGIHETVFKTL